jgi:tetrapyrrole methylase family protein/MazG family protein
MTDRIDIVGLGPGDASLLTGETRDLLESGAPVILRTRRHPTVAALGERGGRFEDCDDLYRDGASFDEVYAAIVERVIAAAKTSGEVIYAVPGHPLVAERTITALLEQAKERGIETRVHAAVSYMDVAAVALQRDLGNVQLCDALDLRLDCQRPALISQVFNRDGAGRLKLQLLELYPAEHLVTVLHALGGPEERAYTTSLAELDHRPFGYLDCVFVPEIAAIDDLQRFDGLFAVVERLHAPDGCPWDREQTHASLRPHLLEEAYEALEAIDAGDADQLAEELGDVLLQVLMHAAVAKREGTFEYSDVNAAIARKLIRRHPHVFGEATAANAEEVYQNWEALKQQEKPRTSILEGVPRSLPALAASQSLQGRARRIGFDWPDIEGPLEKLREEIDEFAHAEGEAEREDEFGDVLFVVANIAQRLGIEAEQALRHANEKFRRRFGEVERLAAEEQVDLRDLDITGLDALWDRAKELERQGR